MVPFGLLNMTALWISWSIKNGTGERVLRWPGEIHALLGLDPSQSLILPLKLVQMVEWKAETRRSIALRFLSQWRATESSLCLQSWALGELLREERWWTCRWKSWPSFGILALCRNWLRNFLICFCQQMLFSVDTTGVRKRSGISSCSCAVAVTGPFELLVVPCCGSVGRD